MAEKPAPKPTDDTYSDEEAATRTDATIRAMIGMKPKPHAETRSAKPRSGKRVHKTGSEGSKAR